MTDIQIGPSKAERLAALFAETQRRVRRVSSELEQIEAAAEGLRKALAALGVEVEGGLSEISGDRLRTEIFNVLRDADPDQRGIHYQEIAELVESRGHLIRGRNKAANALAHMSQSPLFRSFGRGVWTWAQVGSDGGDGAATHELATGASPSEVRPDTLGESAPGLEPAGGFDGGEAELSQVGALADLEFGEVYRRGTLHDFGLGGDQQKGISYPADGDHVLLFSHPGHTNDFGYMDGWEEPGLYRYFGEWRGQGDMTMSGGNAAIPDRSPNLYLFIAVEGGYRYEGRFAYVTHRLEPALRNGVQLQAMVFMLGAVRANASADAKASSPT